MLIIKKLCEPSGSASFAAMVFFLLFLTACEQSKEQEKMMSNIPKTSDTSKNHIKAVEILTSFNRDVSVCRSAVMLFETDPSFMNVMYFAESRLSKSLGEHLRNASFAKEADIQYMIANEAYFVVDLSNHINEFAIAWTKSSSIFCQPSELRLKEIEAVGASAEAWQIRVHFLNRWLANLISPSFGTEFDTLQYKYFNQFVGEAARLYSTSHRVIFHAWVNKAIQHLLAQRESLEETSGETEPLDKQKEYIDNEVTILESFLQ